MADKKISELPAATTVAGADLVGVVQGGSSKKATVSLLQPSTAAALLATATGLWIPTHCPANGVVGVWANEGTGGSAYDIPVAGTQRVPAHYQSYFFQRQQFAVDRSNETVPMAFYGRLFGVRPADGVLPGNIITYTVNRVEANGGLVAMVQSSINVHVDHSVHWVAKAWSSDRLTNETSDITLATPMPASIPASAPVTMWFGVGPSGLSVRFGGDSASWTPSTAWGGGVPFNNYYEFDVDRPAQTLFESFAYANIYACCLGTIFPVVGADGPADTVTWVHGPGDVDILPAASGPDGFTILTWGGGSGLTWDHGSFYFGGEAPNWTLTSDGTPQLALTDDYPFVRNAADIYRYEACAVRWDAVAGQWWVKGANLPWRTWGPTAGTDPTIVPTASTVALALTNQSGRLALWTRQLTADETETVFRSWFTDLQPELTVV